MDSKLIYDPIHGYIKFNSLELNIIDSSIFKRLQNIKQLGTCHYVFPGANHTRFSHSLGTCYLAGKLLESIHQRQPDIGITAREIQLVKIAGLCHDLGHGPFSHTFDNVVIPYLKDHNIPFNIDSCHELRSIHLLDQIIKQKNIAINQSELIFISLCINPNKKKIDDSDYPRKFLFTIISNYINGIDVDKFDYLKRDPYHIGLDFHFDYNRIIENIRVIDDIICFPKKLANTIINMFSVRYRLLREICNHPVTKSIEYMILDILVNDYQILLPFLNNDTFYKLDDRILLFYKMSTNIKSTISQKLLVKLDNRELYKYMGEVKCNNKHEREKINMLEKKSNYIIQNLKVSYSNIEQFPLNTVLFYNLQNQNSYFNITEEEICILLPNKYMEEHTYRIFIKDCNPELMTELSNQYQTLNLK